MSLLCCLSDMAFREPDIALSLDSAATSLLDGQLVDQSGKTLYQIETADAFTKITPVHSSSRSRRSTTRASANAMTIRWPQRYSLQTNNNGDNVVSSPDALVTVNGETTASKRLLRRRKLVTDGKSYKFRIDGYKPTFRWKRKRSQYQLHVSGNRQPIAYLSNDHLTTTFTVEVYGASIPSYHAQDRPGLVSSVLLDHIVLTSILLVTPPLEWRRVCGATATRITMTTESDDMEEPPTFVYSAPHRQQRQGPPSLADPFDDSCAAPNMREMASRNFYFPPSSTTYPSADGSSVELSRTSTSSSRTLVQSLVRTVLASISSDDSSLFATTEDSSSYYGRSVASQSPPPPYQPAPSRR